MILLIAIGNVLRRDDGAAHRVLELLEETPGVRRLSCHQLTPELAEDMAEAAQVVFIDADISPGVARLEPLETREGWNPMGGHSLGPWEVVALAERLYGFQGKAWVCRVPGEDFEDGAGLSPCAEAAAQRAAAILGRFLQPGD